MGDYKEWWKNPAIASYIKSANPEAPAASPQPIGSSGGQYGYTGKGPDGVAQPDRRVAGMGNDSYDVHENEFVLNADAVQAIGPDVLNDVQETIKSGGNVDVNKIRESIGGDPQQGLKCGGKPGYQEGGLTPGAPEAETVSKSNEQDFLKRSNESSGINTTKDLYSGLMDKGKQSAANTITPIGVTPGPTPEGLNMPSPKIPGIAKPEIGGPPTPQRPGPSTPGIARPEIGPTGGLPTPSRPSPRIPEIAKPKIGPAGGLPTPSRPGPSTPGIGLSNDANRPDSGLSLRPEINKTPGREDITPIGPQPDPAPGPDDISAIEYMKQIMGGDNPYFEQIKNMYSQDMGGAGAASAAAMRQQATQAGMSPEQIASMSATFGRDSQQSVSNMLGSLALGQSEMQYQAAKDVFGMEMEKKQFEFAKEKYGDAKANQVLNDVNGGMSLKMLQEKYPDMNITQGDYDKMWDASQMGWQQEVFNQQMEFSKEQYGDLEGQRIAGLVNQGWSLEQLQKEFPDKNITQEDYDQLQSYSNMGFQKEQWEYSKKVDAFNQLIEQGGEGNFQKAAKMFNSMFGTQVDFSNAITEENKQNFNESWNNMTSSIAGNMTFEDWKNTAIADGTYDNLNMTDADIKTMYENMQLSNNPTYQALTQYDKMLEKGVLNQDQYDRVTNALKYGITHPEGFTFSDGYQVLDKDGKEVDFFKTQEEADQYLASHPDQEYSVNVEKEGWVEYGGGSGTGPGGTTDKQVYDNVIADQVPPEYEDVFTFQDWEDAGKPQTWGEYKNYIGEEITKITDKYPTPEAVYNSKTGELNVSQDDLKKMAFAMDMGIGDFSKYELPPGDKGSEFINTALNSNAVVDENGNISAWGAVPPEWLDRRDQSMNGKIVSFSDSEGNKRRLVIKGVSSNEVKGSVKRQHVYAYDIDSGATIKISLGDPS